MNINPGFLVFERQLEADGRSVHTIRQYRRHVRLFAAWCAENGLCGDVSEIGHEHIAQFLSSPAARLRPDGGVKRATSVNALRSSLRGFFQYLHRAGYIRQDPTRLTRRALCGTAPPRGLTEAEQVCLLASLAEGLGFVAERDHALFHVMLATGIRVGSAVDLDVDDVDLERGELWIRTVKGDRPDRVFLNDRIRDHLREYLKRKRSGPLFQGREGTRLSTRHVQRRLTYWLKRAGITRHASPHALRHAFAMRIYHRTGDILVVKEALRHRSITSTLVYAEVSEARLRAAIQG